MADLYEVRRMREITRLSDEGKLVKHYRIEAVTAKGVSFTVEILESEADPKTVKGILEGKAKQLDGIMSL